MSKDKIIKPKNIFIIRHAEKENPVSAETPEDGRSLSFKGQMRAQGLAEQSKFLIPLDHFIAAQSTKHSQRPFETLLPIATKAGQSIITDYRDDQYAKLAKDLFSKKKYDSKNILIAWHHGKIPELLDVLGVKIPGKMSSPIKNGKWDEKVYNQVVQLRSSFPESYKVMTYSQCTLYGD
jgi:hypothetical protein